jgi:hypothetical protein
MHTFPLNIAHVIKHIMSSATEAELAALYIMAQEAVDIRIILKQLGHKQPPTPIQTANAMADAIINGKVEPKQNERKQWTCDSTGASSGAQANKIVPTIGQNTTLQRITSTCAKTAYHNSNTEQCTQCL